MARRRFRTLRSTKAWPLLIVLAGVYWLQKQFGITDAASFSKKLNESSSALLQYAPWLFAAALFLLLLRVLLGKKKLEPQSSGLGESGE